MTRPAKLDLAFRHVVEATAGRVVPFGFIRRGAIFRKVTQGNCGIVEFQKSLKSSSDKILFTINVAVVCGKLLEPWQPDLDKTRSMDGHLRERIGKFLFWPRDKWWEIKLSTREDALADEVSELVSSKAIPFVERYLDEANMVALWESGQSPGLTETERVRYLNVLRDGRANKV